MCVISTFAYFALDNNLDGVIMDSVPCSPRVYLIVSLVLRLVEQKARLLFAVCALDMQHLLVGSESVERVRAKF